MALYPRATKTGLVRLLKARGLDIPKAYETEFSRIGRAYWLRWADKQGIAHSAYYSAAGGLPVLSIDKQFADITLGEVIGFGLYEEK